MSTSSYQPQSRSQFQPELTHITLCDDAGNKDCRQITVTQRTDHPIDHLIPLQSQMRRTPAVISETLSKGVNSAQSAVEEARLQKASYCSSIKREYNQSIAIPINSQIANARTVVGQQRRENPFLLVGGFAAGLALLGTPFGRHAVIRNGGLGALFASWCVWPQTTTGALIVISDRLRGAPQQSTSTTIVVERSLDVKPIDQQQQ